MRLAFTMVWGVPVLLYAATGGSSVELRHNLEGARKLLAKSAWQEARGVLRKLVPELRASGDSGALAEALSGLSQAALALGEYPEAATAAREAAILFESQHHPREAARAWNNAGLADMQLGRWDEAVDQYRRALDLDRQSGDVANEIIRLNNIANVCFLRGRYTEAAQLYQQALARGDRVQRAPAMERALRITRANMAALYQRVGREDRALELYRGMHAKQDALTASERARLITNIGVLYRRLGDPYKSLEQYRAARALFARDKHADGEIGVLKNTGIARALDLGDLNGALSEFTAALRLAERAGNRREALQLTLYRGEVLRRQGRLREAVQAFESAAEAARQTDDAEDHWKALYGLGRAAQQAGDAQSALARYLESTRVIERLRSGIQAPELRSDFLADKRDVYDAAIEILAARANADLGMIFGLIELARSRGLQDRLRFAADSISLEAVRARLEPSELLVSLWTGPETAAALWITAGAAGFVRVPWSPEEAENTAQLAMALSRESGPPVHLAKLAIARLFTEVLKTGGSGKKHVLIVPDGVLGRFPFDLIRTPEGRLLIESASVSHLPAATYVLASFWKRAPRWRAPLTLQIAAFGDPVIAAADRSWNGNTRAPLPHTRDEIASITSALSGRALVYLSAEALKQNFMAQASAAPIIHIASHAAVDPQDAERSHILFSPRPGEAGQDYLFHREIGALHLENACLVTLSACDTAAGRLRRGEGIDSLGRAFLAAGAQSTVTTLWRVPDRATARFMTIFYSELARGATKAEAMRTAKLLFLRSGTRWSHPRYWAAFIVTGDALSGIPRTVPISWMMAGVAVAVAAAGFLTRLRRRRSSPIAPSVRQ